MAEMGLLQVIIGADISAFEKNIKKVQRDLDKLVGKDFVKFAGQVRTAMMGLAGALGLVGVAAVKSAAQLEQQKVAFTTLLKSAQKADDFLRKLQSFAAATPFQFDELVDASKKMLAFGFAADDVLPTLRKVGDAAAGLGLGGDGIDRIVRAIGQMQSKGKVSAQEINQLAEAGIGAWDYLAKAAGKSVAEVQKASEKGLISGKAGVAAIIAGMDSQFKGLMEKQSGTINGILSNITDNIGEAMRGLGEALVTDLPIKDALIGIRDALGAFAQQVSDSGFVNALQLVFLKVLGPGTISVLTALAAVIGTTLVYSLTSLSLALTRLIAAHPYLLVFAAAVTAITYAFQKWDLISYTIQNLVSNIKAWFGTAYDVITNFASMVADAVVLVLAKVTQKVFEIISGSATVVADMAKQLLPRWAQFAADIVTILNPVYNKIASIAANTADTYAKKFETALMKVGSAMSENIEIAKKEKEEHKKAYEQKVAAAKGAQEYHELELTYGKRISKAFEDVKSSVVSAYESIKTSGSSAWMAGITLIEQFIDKLQSVTSFMIPIIGAANALREAFGFAGIDFSLGNTEEGNGKKKSGAGGGGGKGKSAADQAREAAELYRDTFREFRDLKKELQAPQQGAAGFFQQLDAEIGGVRDRWIDALDQIAAKFEETNRQGKDAILRGLNEAGVAYQVAENGKLDFARQRMANELLLEQEKQARILEYQRSGQMLEDELRRAANERDLAEYTQLLSSKNAAFLAQIEGERQAMDAYRSLMLEANRSNLSYMAEASQVLTQGLTDAIVGVVTGTKKAGEAFRELGKQIITMVVKWMVQRAISAAAAKALEHTMAASSSAAAATVNAAWAPAAANVAIATMGGAIGPAVAGLTAATASYRAMNMTGLARGGIVTAPTVAMVGEGRYDEAVIPLSPSVLGKLGGGGGDVRVNIYNNTGQPVSARQERSVDGQGTLVSVWLDAYDRDVGGLRSVVNSRRS